VQGAVLVKSQVNVGAVDAVGRLLGEGVAHLGHAAKLAGDARQHAVRPHVLGRGLVVVAPLLKDTAANLLLDDILALDLPKPGVRVVAVKPFLRRLVEDLVFRAVHRRPKALVDADDHQVVPRHFGLERVAVPPDQLLEFLL